MKQILTISILCFSFFLSKAEFLQLYDLTVGCDHKVFEKLVSERSFTKLANPYDFENNRVDNSVNDYLSGYIIYDVPYYGGKMLNQFRSADIKETCTPISEKTAMVQVEFLDGFFELATMTEKEKETQLFIYEGLIRALKIKYGEPDLENQPFPNDGRILTSWIFDDFSVDLCIFPLVEDGTYTTIYLTLIDFRKLKDLVSERKKLGLD